MQNKFSVQLQMTGHRTDGNHGPGSNPSKLRTLATKKSRCWRNQAITLTENLAIRSHLMSLGIPPELRQAGSYLFARRISPDKRISSVLDFLTRCRLPVTYLDRDMEFVWNLKHLDKTSCQRSSSVQIKPPQLKPRPNKCRIPRNDPN
jgi:hypothetical protein